VDYLPRNGRSKVTGTVLGTWHAASDMRRLLPVRPQVRPRLIVIAKAPVPGLSKTRLCPPCTPVQAAAVAEAALADTLAATWTSRRPAGARPRWAGGPGCRGHQGGPTAGRRAGRADRRCLRGLRRPGPVDRHGHPAGDARLLRRCVDALMAPGIDAALGPALDGGWWAAGLRRPIAVPSRRPMSTGQTLRPAAPASRGLGLQFAELPTLSDVDVWEDALSVSVSMSIRGWQPAGASRPRWRRSAARGWRVSMDLVTRTGSGCRWSSSAGSATPTPWTARCRRVLRRCRCRLRTGPRQNVVALAAAGIPALASMWPPSAVHLAWTRGACVRTIRLRPVPVPAVARPSLLDGNGGIGGDLSAAGPARDPRKAGGQDPHRGGGTGGRRGRLRRGSRPPPVVLVVPVGTGGCRRPRAPGAACR